MLAYSKEASPQLRPLELEPSQKAQIIALLLTKPPLNSDCSQAVWNTVLNSFKIQ